MFDVILKSLDGFIELIGAGLCIVFIVGFSYVNTAYQEADRNNKTAAATMREVREFNSYNDNELKSQDVISAVLQYRGQPELWIDTAKGNTTTWGMKYTLDTQLSEYDVETLTAKFDIEDTYVGELVKDDNGSIERIEFYNVTP